MVSKLSVTFVIIVIVAVVKSNVDIDYHHPSRTANVRVEKDFKVESDDGKHSMKAGGGVGHTFPVDKFRDGRTDVGVNAGYKYESGDVSVLAGVNAEQSFQHGRSSDINYNAGVKVKVEF